MVVKRQCSFCAGEVEPGTGTMFVKRDGTVFFFCSSSCRKQQLHLGRVGHRLKWTRAHAVKRAQAHSSAQRAGRTPPVGAPPVKRSFPAAPRPAPAAVPAAVPADTAAPAPAAVKAEAPEKTPTLPAEPAEKPAAPKEEGDKPAVKSPKKPAKPRAKSGGKAAAASSKS